jgi:hypothetical protein
MIKVKTTILIVSLLSVTLFGLTACSKAQPDESMSKPSVTSVTEQSGEVDSYDRAVYAGDGYTFEFSDSGDNYIINCVTTQSDLLFTIENRFFEVSTCLDSIPSGFQAGILSEDNCLILPGRFPSDPQKELLQVILYNPDTEVYASKIYGIKDGRFMPLNIFNNSLMMMTPLNTIPESTLIPSETNKFMTTPQVIYSETGTAVVSIFTYTFDPNAMSFIKEAERISADNPLYFGYAAHTVATDLYGYFVDKTLTINPDMNVEAYYNNATDTEEYYFAVDDPRFSTLAEFESYIRQYFSEELATEMFRSAPQKYRDINGRLHTLSVNSTRDPSLGSVILTDAVIEESDIFYPVEQFITIGGTTALTPKAEFIIDSTNPPSWKALRYVYPYK